jgi:hypothetical protein
MLYAPNGREGGIDVCMDGRTDGWVVRWMDGMWKCVQGLGEEPTTSFFSMVINLQVPLKTGLFFANSVTTDYFELDIHYLKAMYRIRLMFTKIIFRSSSKSNPTNSKYNRFDGIA